MNLDGINYWVSFALMMIGLFGVISSGNLVKKLICMVIFQASALLFYISIGYVTGSAPPVITGGDVAYVNPLPQVLMLTAIVVGLASLALGLAIGVRIKEAYGTIEEDEIFALDSTLHNFASTNK
jgi:multicomponent Na+:H+ antiporter subunit C